MLEGTPEAQTAWTLEVNRIASLIRSAFTLVEAEEARREYRALVARFPEAAALDLAHGFHYIEDGARERAEAARAMGLTPEQEAERDELLRHGRPNVPLFPDTEGARAVLDAARSRLVAWLGRYPEDPHAQDRLRWIDGDLEILDLYEQMPEPAGVAA